MTLADSISAQKHAALGLYTYVEFGATVLAFLPIMGASWLRHRGDPTQRMPGRWMRRLGWVSSALTPLWKFRTEGAAPAGLAVRTAFPHIRPSSERPPSGPALR